MTGRRIASALALAFGLTTFAGPGLAEQPRSHSQMVHDVVDHHVVPHIEKLRDATQALSRELSGLCSSAGDAAALARVKDKFSETVAAWAGVEFIRFGPMSEGGRAERFAFWPDTRGILFRQLPQVLAKRDAELLKPGALGPQSAAVQGLHALELLITDETRPITGADDDGRYRCQFAAAIGINLNGIAAELVAAWEAPDGWRHRMFGPGSDNPIYPEPADAARDLVRSLLTGLQLVQERQVKPRLDTLLGEAKVPRLPFERSGLGVIYLTAGVRSLKEFSQTFGLSDYAEQGWMKGWMIRAFDLLVRDAPSVPQKPVAAADPAKADKGSDEIRLLRQMRFHLNGLRHMIGRQLAPAAGLSIGFNELDGD